MKQQICFQGSLIIHNCYHGNQTFWASDWLKTCNCQFEENPEVGGIGNFGEYRSGGECMYRVREGSWLDEGFLPLVYS